MTEEREAALLRAFAKNDFAVVHALFSIISSREARFAVEATFKYFQAMSTDGELLLELLKSVIDKEIEVTDEAATLFRSNSAGSKLLSLTLKNIGNNYLISILRGMVTKINQSSNPAVGSIALGEIDPARLTSQDTLETNVHKLTSLCRSFLARILKSVDNCPLFFRKLCNYLQMGVVRKFPNSEQIRKNFSAIGGLLFLRFICPALFTPHLFDLIKEPATQSASRTLVLVSKVLQMLANGLQFNEGDSYMCVMNPFLHQYNGDIVDFFITIATVPNDHDLERMERKRRMLSESLRAGFTLVNKEPEDEADDSDSLILDTDDTEDSDDHSLGSGATLGMKRGRSISSSAPNLPMLQPKDQASPRQDTTGSYGGPPGAARLTVPTSPQRSEDDDAGDGTPPALDVLHALLYTHRDRILKTLHANTEHQEAHKYFNIMVNSFPCPSIDFDTLIRRDRGDTSVPPLTLPLPPPVPGPPTSEEHPEKKKGGTPREKEGKESKDKSTKAVFAAMLSKDKKHKGSRGEADEKVYENKLNATSVMKSMQHAKTLEKVQKRLTDEQETRRQLEMERDNTKLAKEYIEKEVIELLQEKIAMKAEVELLKRQKEAVEVELSVEKRKTEAMSTELDHYRKQREDHDSKVKALLRVAENATRERDLLSDEVRTLRERLAALERDRSAGSHPSHNSDATNGVDVEEDATVSKSNDKTREGSGKLKRGRRQLSKDSNLKLPVSIALSASATSTTATGDNTQHQPQSQQQSNDHTSSGHITKLRKRDKKEQQDVKDSSSRRDEKPEPSTQQNTNTTTNNSTNKKDDKRSNSGITRSDRKDKEKELKKDGSYRGIPSSKQHQQQHQRSATSSSSKGDSSSCYSASSNYNGEHSSPKSSSLSAALTSSLPVIDEHAPSYHKPSVILTTTTTTTTTTSSNTTPPTSTSTSTPTTPTPTHITSTSNDESSNTTVTRTGSDIKREVVIPAGGLRERGGLNYSALPIPPVLIEELGLKMHREMKLWQCKHNLKKYDNCFKGVQAIDWLLAASMAKSRGEASNLCGKMLAAALIVPLSSKEPRFMDDDTVYYFVGNTSITNPSGSSSPHHHQHQHHIKYSAHHHNNSRE
eukprot:TRINITY_DN3797_c0_g1_i1.p1 TRINITY_DN3797_c0_g1~~TRINITY_DN3797_c0_g1_i1.p1  ORF type:complete len:1107 (-),score=266.57 TRINITY_DN3797_c0_g1_i1:12-3332(-)